MIRDFVDEGRTQRLRAFARVMRKLKREYFDSRPGIDPYYGKRDPYWGWTPKQLFELMHRETGDVRENSPGDVWTWMSYLYQATRQFRPRNVVEIGVQLGRSTFAILQGMEDNEFGTLHSIDVIPAPLGKRWVAPLVPGHLKKRWKYHEGLSVWMLPKVLGKLDRVDMLYHDGNHTPELQFDEISQVWAKGAEIVVVDCAPPSDFAKYSRELNPPPSIILPGVFIRNSTRTGH